MAEESERPDTAAHRNAQGLAALGQGRFDTAIAQFEGALDRDPRNLDALANLANAYVGADRLDEAVALYRRVLARSPRDAAVHNNLGGALLEMGDAAGAVASLRQATALAPHIADYHTALGNALHATGDPKAALAAFDDSLACKPGNGFALAFKLVVLSELGEAAALDALCDYESRVRTIRIECPDGYADLGMFNHVLSAHVLGHSTLVHDRPRRATRGGAVAGNLLAAPKGPVAALESAVLEQIQAYVGDLPPDPEDPVAAGCPERAGLVMWGTVLDSGGYQESHNHPNGWLSGVYYPKLPPDMSGPTADRAGWLRFGEPPPAFAKLRTFDTLDLQPEEGLMVLFPSYFWHRTLPFDSAEPRISIAFDLSPRP